MFFHENTFRLFSSNASYCFILSSIFLLQTDMEIKQANWDATKTREKLRRDIEAHVESVCRAKLSEITADYEVWQSCYLEKFNSSNSLT